MNKLITIIHKTKKMLVKKLRNLSVKQRKIAVILLIASAGSIFFFVNAGARQFSIFLKPQSSGQLSGVEVIEIDSASEGSAIRFGSASVSPPTISDSYDNIPSNVNPADWLMRAWEQNPRVGYPAFRSFCQFSHLEYHDPIISPGNNRFRHLHMFFGNTGAKHTSTYQTLRTTGDSTCDGGPLNRTAYWMPAVFDGNDNVVVPTRFELYYKAENASNINNIVAKPNGLRMVAGAPDMRVFRWTCSGNSSTSIPGCPTGSRLTVSVRFPYCWDGKNLDSQDHRSHMAYGTNNTWGSCPSSHPVHLPELTEFAHFDNVSNTRDWYISSDRENLHEGHHSHGSNSQVANGSTMHADWFGAWDNNIQDRWVNNCLKGNRSASNGNLCDGEQLLPATSYNGPQRISGWKPTP